MFICNLLFAEYIQPKKLTWVNSTSTDVVKHRLYLVPEAQAIDYFSSPHVDLDVPINEYTLPGVFTIGEGNYRAGIASMDAAGNISNITEKVFPLDQTPPNPPTNLQLVDG